MRAAWYERNGPASEVLRVGQIDTPRPGPGEVLVRLAASGVNPSDVKSRQGRPLAFARIVPHSDGAGVIEVVGEGVDGALVGKRVWIWNGQWKRPFGTAATHIALPVEQVVTMPGSVDFDTAACFGIPGLTAWWAVDLCGELEGRTVLVTGAASGVGHYAVQMARLKGARVIGTASAPRHEHALAAGCEAVIDYRSEPAAERIRELTKGIGVDAIIDMDLSSMAPMLGDGILRAHGLHVCYGSNQPDVALSFPAMLWNSLTLKVFVVYDLTPAQRRRTVAGFMELVERDVLAHSIGARFALDDIVAAHEAVEAGKTIGNVVLDCR